VPLVNYATREITCKIVYYGPGRSGKTTNLHYIYGQVPIDRKGRMVSLATQTDRTLFFDFLPLDLGSVRGFKTRIHLYTVPGQVFYDASRKLILRGVDGIVFVADSQEQRMDANVEALDNLMSNLKEHGYDFNKIPYVLQLNKRDLPNILPVDALSKELRKKNEAVVEAVAFQGTGVFETLKEIAKQVLTELKAGG
jgi:signal recognition particle receptor subunit beta